ncbi:eukaryotic translation initiation factor 3 subunit L-like, partial [Amphibalanus amphitrite]|uniref:eukaryotic translation initiation factor 3 subunit L-like n=1 Tax=Amphibalanus amphitrite TaxID=1232801 RepID=UPI001C8FDAD1
MDYGYGYGYESHTGDPRLDMEYERQYGQYSQHSMVPDPVRRFVIHLRNMIRDKNVGEIQQLYEHEFPRLTQEFFEKQPWPEAEEIQPYVSDDDDEAGSMMFLILYKELYFRHLYALSASNIKLENRFHSFFNYCSLFNLILMSETPISLELPNQWLWDIIDEFIYQFQAFTQYRNKPDKSPSDLEQLKEHTVWNVLGVLNVLHSLVEKSNINQQLEVYTSGGNPDSAAGEFGRHPLYKMLGYFSLIGLLRLHSLLGDYYQAIKVLENIELNKKALYSRVPACQITTYYYVGFAYLMMRRYADAIRTFSNILLYIQRTKQQLQGRGYQSEHMSKQTDKMYTLLAMCLVLHPQSIDESVQSVLSEKYQERMLKMSRGDRKEFVDSFRHASPKFLSPVPPVQDGPIMGVSPLEPQRQQLNVFMDEVDQQVFLDAVSRHGAVPSEDQLTGQDPPVFLDVSIPIMR